MFNYFQNLSRLKSVNAFRFYKGFSEKVAPRYLFKNMLKSRESLSNQYVYLTAMRCARFSTCCSLGDSTINLTISPMLEGVKALEGSLIPQPIYRFDNKVYIFSSSRYSNDRNPIISIFHFSNSAKHNENNKHIH